MRFIVKHRHIITAVIVILFLGVLVYLGTRLQNLKKEDVTADTFAGTAMGTAVKKTIYSDNPVRSEEVSKEIDTCLKELENQISVRVSGSEVNLCNRNYAVDGVYELSDNLIGYLKQEMDIYKETDGAFSPCIRPLADLWGIEDGKAEVPDDTRIQDTLGKTDASKIEITDNGIIFHKGNMAIDFGASGKGIACDQITEVLQENGVDGAVISVGGSIAVYGSKGNGKDWHIGIRDPRGDEDEVLGVVDFSGSKMISTSGDYEKYFESGAKRYHHILDPATGYPADNDLMSVTVISANGFLSDALSTACFVMGLEKGMDYAEEKGVDAVFVTKDKKVYVTKNLKKSFHIKADDYKLVKKNKQSGK